MAEVSRIRKKQMSGAGVVSLLNPQKKANTVKNNGLIRDHRRENYLRIKETEMKNKIKEKMASIPSPSPFKLKEFMNVPSRLSTHRCNSLESINTLSSTLNSIEVGERSRPSTAGSKKSNLSSGGHSFIAANAAAASKAPSRTHKSQPTREPKRSTPNGQIPKYLLDRKMNWAKKEEEKLAALEAGKIPKGMMIISADEKQNTLKFLEQVRKGLILDLSRFPVIVETPSMKKKRAAIETKLAEVDASMETFSKKTVYVEKEWCGVESSLNSIAKAAQA